MNPSDEELQKGIETGRRVDESQDSRAYRKIFDALKKEPYQLPSNFAEQVINRINATDTSLSKDYFWFGLGLISFIVAAVIAVVLSDFEINFGELKFFSGYAGLAAFGLIFIALIQYIDKQFIRRDLI